MKRKPLVYIAGPYTNPDPVENTHNAIVCGEWIEEDFDVAVVIPHLSMLWHLVRPAPLEIWYQRDLHVLERCDAVYRMIGISTGADAEVTHARLHEIPAFCEAERSNNRILEWRCQWKPAAR